MKQDNTSRLFTEVGLLIKSRLQMAIAMPFSQCQTLSFIANNTSPSMQDIAQYFKIRAPSATFLVEELVRGGYVARHANAKDRRRVELMLTPKGRTKFKTIEEKRTGVLSKVFRSLEDKDRQELERILEKIIHNE